jgi:hypothetical protein
MDWTMSYFGYKAQQWVSRMQTAEANMSNADGNANLYTWEGYKCYAARQAHVYHQLANHAQSSFQQLKANGLMH